MSLQTALHLPACDFVTIEKARKLGLFLRYGFVWQEGGHVLTDDTTMLELFLGSESIQGFFDWMILTS
jgi:hypothetical protein